jgi:hypothetical protein
MKIINVDSFNMEDKDDFLVCDNVSYFYGKYLTEFLNIKFSGNNSSDYFMLVEDNYELYKFEI